MVKRMEMKIKDALSAYSAQTKMLWERKKTLSKALEEHDSLNGSRMDVDRVELSRELSMVEAQYEESRKAMEQISGIETMIHNREVAKQQSEAMEEYAKNMARIMEVYRRISSGEKVPPEDEQKLMEYDYKMYQAAKLAAQMHEASEEEHDSLWEDEENTAERKQADEIAGDTEIDVPMPEELT